MTRQTSVRILAVLLLAAGLVLRPHPLGGQGKSVPADDNTLTAELDAELSDVEAEDKLVDESTVEEQIESDLEKSTQVDYHALEAEMERGGTTLQKVIQQAVKEAESEDGEQFAAFLQGSPQVNGKSAEKHFVADVRVIHDHVKENRKLTLPGQIPDAKPPRP